MYESQFDTKITLNLKISSKFEHNLNGNNHLGFYHTL